MIYYLKAVCLYVALEDTINLLNFYNSFDRNFNNVFDKKLSTLTTLGIFLPVNPYLFWNLFFAQHTDKNIDLDTDSIADFNVM